MFINYLQTPVKGVYGIPVKVSQTPKACYPRCPKHPKKLSGVFLLGTQDNPDGVRGIGVWCRSSKNPTPTLMITVLGVPIYESRFRSLAQQQNFIYVWQVVWFFPKGMLSAWHFLMFLYCILDVGSRLMKQILAVFWWMLDRWFVLFHLTMSLMCSLSIQNTVCFLCSRFYFRDTFHQTRREQLNLFHIL